jgi:hypothetical protein
MALDKSRKKEYEKSAWLIASALFISLLLLAPTAHAQNKAAKVQAIAQQLDLTPQQKVQILPILADEAPKVEAIKNDNSLSKVQKIQQIRAIHRQTDPQMKAILFTRTVPKATGDSATGDQRRCSGTWPLRTCFYH